MASLRPYKFVVTAIVQEVDDDGNVTGEAQIGGGDGRQPFTVFGCDNLAKWSEDFPTLLTEQLVTS